MAVLRDSELSEFSELLFDELMEIDDFFPENWKEWYLERKKVDGNNS